MKGIVLAGGSGTRLYPITKGISKQLLAIYDKPMIFYPISILMLSGIKEILIISTPKDLPSYKKLLGSGTQLGLSFHYIEQPKPQGLAQAFVLGKKFIGSDDVCLVLGDNIIYGQGLSGQLEKSIANIKKFKKATIFGYQVKNPCDFGIVEFDKNKKILSIEEKPKIPKSDYAVIGLYFYPNNVINFVNEINFSSRGELEITSINNIYFEKELLNLEILGRGFTWLDTGTHDSLLQASNFVNSIQKQTGFKIACLEEIAFRKNYINKEELISLVNDLKNNGYSKYLIEKFL